MLHTWSVIIIFCSLFYFSFFFSFSDHRQGGSLFSSGRKSPKDKSPKDKKEKDKKIAVAVETPAVDKDNYSPTGHTKPYEYTDQETNKSPNKRNYIPGGFRYDEDPTIRDKGNDADQLSPNSQARRTATAFNYAPGEEDKLKEQAEKRKTGELSPKSKDRLAKGDGSPVKVLPAKSYSPNSTQPIETPGTPGKYRALGDGPGSKYDPTSAFLDGERYNSQLPIGVAGGEAPKKKRVKILVIVSKFDPKTKRIDTSNGALEHSTGILDTATGKIESKYGLIDPKKGTIEALDTRSGKTETFQGIVEPKSGNLHITSGVTDPKSGKIDDNLGQVICIAPLDNPVVEIVGITGKVDPVTGQIDTVNGDIERTRGVLNLKTGFIDTKYGQINPKTGETKTIDPKSGKATSRPSKLDPVTGHVIIIGAVDPRTGKQDNELGHLVALGQQIDPIVEVVSLTGKLDSKKGIIDPKTLSIENSTGQVDPNSGKIDTKYGQINLIKHTLVAIDPKSGKVDSKDFKVDPITGQLLIKNVVNPKTGKPDKDYGQILSLKIVNKLVDPATGQVISSADGKDIIVDPKTNQVWVAGRKDPKTGEVIYSSSQIDPKTGFVTVIYGYLNPKSNEVEKQTKLDDNLTKVDPITGQVYSAIGEVEGGEQLYAVSQYDQDSGDVYTKVAKVDPKTGKLTIIRITAITKQDSSPVAAVTAPTTPERATAVQSGQNQPSAQKVTPPTVPTQQKTAASATQPKRVATADDAFIPVAAAALPPAENPIIEVVTLIGLLDSKTGKMNPKSAEIERSRGLLNLKTGYIDTKYGQINPISGDCRLIDSKTGAITSTKKAHVDPFTGQITIKGVVDPKTGKLDQQLTQLITFGAEIDPVVEVTSISGKFDNKKGIIDPKTAVVEKTIGQLDKDSGKIDTGYGQFDLTNNVCAFKNPKTGKLETKEIKIDPISGQIVLKNEINSKTGKPDKDFARIVSIRIVHKKIDPRTGNVILSTTESSDIIVDPKTNQLWVPEGKDPITGNTIYTSSQVDPKTGYIITLYGYLNPKTNDIEKQVSVESNLTKIDPISGQVFTATGKVDESSGEPLFAASQIDPESGEVYTKIGRIDPKTGKLILIRIILLTKKDQLGRPQEVDPSTCDIDPVTGRIRNIFNKTVYVYNMVDPVTGEIVQVDPNDPRMAGARTTVTQTMTLTGEIDSVTGRIKTEYGHIDPDTGDIDPTTAVIDPVTGKLILNYAQIDPSHFGKEVTVTKETVPISRGEFYEGIKHMGPNVLRRDSEASSDGDVNAYAGDSEILTHGKYVSTPTVVKTTTKQVLTKNEDGVTHNVEEEIRNLGTGEVLFSTQEHKVSHLYFNTNCFVMKLSVY